jgi:hypothetical protein
LASVSCRPICSRTWSILIASGAKDREYAADDLSQIVDCRLLSGQIDDLIAHSPRQSSSFPTLLVV